MITADNLPNSYYEWIADPPRALTDRELEALWNNGKPIYNFAASNSAQGKPATTGLGALDVCARLDLPAHSTVRGKLHDVWIFFNLWWDYRADYFASGFCVGASVGIAFMFLMWAVLFWK